ncbi:MAG: hypothetical protein EXR74_02725 [Bdellovibrionales bacterium]|nr:hypothetical protein [Bdellovibrionales bacterium]
MRTSNRYWPKSLRRRYKIELVSAKERDKGLGELGVNIEQEVPIWLARGALFPMVLAFMQMVS